MNPPRVVARPDGQVLVYPPEEHAAEAVLRVGRLVRGDGPAGEELAWALAYDLFCGAYAATRAREHAANVAEEAGPVPVRLTPAQARALAAQLLAAANNLSLGVAP